MAQPQGRTGRAAPPAAPAPNLAPIIDGTASPAEDAELVKVLEGGDAVVGTLESCDLIGTKHGPRTAIRIRDGARAVLIFAGEGYSATLTPHVGKLLSFWRETRKPGAKYEPAISVAPALPF